jgi:hypothetical protein
MPDKSFNSYHKILSATLRNDFISALNSIPGGRKLLKPIFAFFLNFDDLWLYNYHPREYNRVINAIFIMTQ